MSNYIELKNDPKLWDKIFIKEYLINAVRKFFNNKGYHELISPILSPMLPTERYLDVIDAFVSDNKGNSKKYHLIPSTERYNKLALIAGLGNHYVISKVFRGLEETGRTHSSEFLMLEWYELDHNYNDLMDTVEELLIYIKRYIDKKLNKESDHVINYQGEKTKLQRPFKRISIPEVLRTYANIELEDIQELTEFRNIAKMKHYTNADEFDWQSLFELIFANEIEPNLPADPCFVYDYPYQLCPLTKLSKKNKLVAEKVELYVNRMEIGNGYSEQTDHKVQEERFKEEEKARRELNKPDIIFDTELISAMELGMPQVAGMGIGIDRLALIYSDARSLSEISFE